MLAILFISSFAFAETVILKSGKTTEGKIIEKTDKYIKIDIQGVPITYFNDEIKSIDGKEPAAPVIKETVSKNNTDTNEVKKKIGSFIQKAIDYAVEGNFKEAFQEYKNASEIKKTQLMEKYLKLLTDILNGKIEKDVGIHLFKGLQLLHYNYNDPSKLKEAIVEFEWVTKASPNCELAHYLLGYTCYHSHCSVTERKNIIPTFKKALEIDPNFAQAHFWLAFAYCFSEQTNDVKTNCQLTVEHYDKAISLDPSLKDIPCDPMGGPCADQLINMCNKVLKGEIQIPKYNEKPYSAISNETIAQATLKTMSTAVEKFASANNGKYPATIAALTGATPPYLNQDYTASARQGYTFAAVSMNTTGYCFTATPVSVGTTGKRTYSIRTGGVIGCDDTTICSRGVCTSISAP